MHERETAPQSRVIGFHQCIPTRVQVESESRNPAKLTSACILELLTRAEFKNRNESKLGGDAEVNF